MQLVRPTQTAAGPLVEVNLDGVLFQDLSFYGDDRLNSRRTMTAWEMEASATATISSACWRRTAPMGCAMR